MSIGLIGRKCGMTRVFTEDGASIPVTVIEVTPGRIVQIKDLETDGYPAVQLTTGSRIKSRATKGLLGHYAKAKVEPGRVLKEFRVSDVSGYQVGDEISVAIFKNIKKIDVTGINKGKGFAGTVKRYNFAMQDATHGNSRSHRVPGSIGQNQDPGRVFKGKKMCGHMGNVQRTTQNLDVVRVDVDNHLILVRGAVPGAIGGNVFIKAAVKKKHSAGEV